MFAETENSEAEAMPLRTREFRSRRSGINDYEHCENAYSICPRRHAATTHRSAAVLTFPRAAPEHARRPAPVNVSLHARACVSRRWTLSEREGARSAFKSCSDKGEQRWAAAVSWIDADLRNTRSWRNTRYSARPRRAQKSERWWDLVVTMVPIRRPI